MGRKTMESTEQIEVGDRVVPIEPPDSTFIGPPVYTKTMLQYVGKTMVVTGIIRQLNLIELNNRFWYKESWVRRPNETN